MSDPQFFFTPGFGERQRRLLHYAQAVRIGDRIEISGQGGWDFDNDWHIAESLVAEIHQAFRNIEATLAAAGAGWQHVIDVNSYHVGLAETRKQVLDTMVERFRHYLPDREPIWTCLGVEALAEPRMRVEIKVTAVV